MDKSSIRAVNKAVNHILGREDVTVKSGYAPIDEVIGGFKNGDLILVGGRPAMGKTAFSIGIAKHSAIDEGKTVLYLTSELTSYRVMERMLTGMRGIHRLESGQNMNKDREKLEDAAEKLVASKLKVKEIFSYSVREIRDYVEKIAADTQVDLIILDYLQLIPGWEENADEIMRVLKSLSIEVDCPILCLSQVSRELEKRDDKHPLIQDIKGKPSVGALVDQVLFLYREGYYDKDADKDCMEVQIAKPVKGEKHRVILPYDYDNGRMSA